MTRARQRGFTLIELMVALLVSSLLVGMILAIFSRMSLAYRGQQQIAGVQQVLAAARAAIELDAKQAGLGMPQGFRTTAAVGTQSPVQVVNDNANPDQIAFFYVDPSIQAVVTFTGWPNSVQVDQATGFTPGMLVALATASTAAAPTSGDPDIAAYDTCVLRIAAGGVAGTTITLEQVAPWGQAGNIHCPTRVDGRTMLYRLVAHAYRIDNTSAPRAALGPLQQSVTGGLLGVNDVWSDLAYGFSDLQTALRIQDTSGVDWDNDGDATRNWYSGGNQAGATANPAAVLQMTITLVAHTDRAVEGISTAATPNLIGPNPVNPLVNPAIPNNNQLGDRPSTVLPLAPPWPDPLLPGLSIYRYSTFQIDFRNLGIGQL